MKTIFALVPYRAKGEWIQPRFHITSGILVPWILFRFLFRNFKLFNVLNMFRKRKENPALTRQEAVLKLRSAEKMLSKKDESLEKQIDVEDALARKFKNGRSERCSFCDYIFFYSQQQGVVQVLLVREFARKKY